MSETYDLIAIGAGPAGEAATELAAFFGHRSAVIEKNKPGGTVTTTGGVPTKTLREAALYISGFRDRDVYGLQLAAAPQLAADTIRNRTRSVCDLLQRVTAETITAHGVEYVQGSARLGPDRTVVMRKPDGQERTLRAKVILIATGSRPRRPSRIPFGPGVYDTDTILQLGRAPKDILILGGGPTGVEFATICHALGARVTVADLGDRLIPMMDGEMSSRMTALFTTWGIHVNFGCTAEAVNGTDGKVQVSLSTGEVLQPDTVLFAAGRAPNTEELMLEAAGVELDAKGRVAVDERFRTTAPGIYAAGDVLAPTLASIAMEQGRAAVCHAFGIPFEGTVDPTPVSAVYGMPEVAGAGLTEEQCRERGLVYDVGRSDLGLIPRGAIAGRGGLLKLIFLNDSRKLLGVHCIGDIASEIVGIGQMAIRCGGTMHTIMNMSMATPTYSYAYKYAAFEGLRKLAKIQETEGAIK